MSDTILDYVACPTPGCNGNLSEDEEGCIVCDTCDFEDCVDADDDQDQDEAGEE